MAINVNLGGMVNTSLLHPTPARPETTVANDDSTTSDLNSIRADAQAGSEAGAGSSKKDTLEKLQKQITEVAKHMRELQQQLQQAKSGQGSSEEKNTQVVAIQAQIASANATMMALQATMITLQHSVDTTA